MEELRRRRFLPVFKGRGWWGCSEMGRPRETSDLQSVEERFAVGIRGAWGQWSWYKQPWVSRKEEFDGAFGENCRRGQWEIPDEAQESYREVRFPTLFFVTSRFLEHWSCEKERAGVSTFSWQPNIFLWLFNNGFSCFFHFFRVGIAIPEIEVRYEHLTIDAEAFVGSRALPSFHNFMFSKVEVTTKHRSLTMKSILLCLSLELDYNFFPSVLKDALTALRILSNKRRKFTILHDVSGIIKPRRWEIEFFPSSEKLLIDW